jgi:hypothetical protein
VHLCWHPVPPWRAKGADPSRGDELPGDGAGVGEVMPGSYIRARCRSVEWRIGCIRPELPAMSVLPTE